MLTGDKLIREILLQARTDTNGRSNGWIVIRVPGVSESDLALHIREASDRDLVKAREVGGYSSPHEDWKVLDITASGLQFLENTKPAKKARAFAWAAVVLIAGFLGWLIPVVISLRKK